MKFLNDRFIAIPCNRVSFPCLIVVLFYLKNQIAELDMLTAMFPSEDELLLDNPAIICEINDWIEHHQFKVIKVSEINVFKKPRNELKLAPIKM